MVSGVSKRKIAVKRFDSRSSKRSETGRGAFRKSTAATGEAGK